MAKEVVVPKKKTILKCKLSLEEFHKRINNAFNIDSSFNYELIDIFSPSDFDHVASVEPINPYTQISVEDLKEDDNSIYAYKSNGINCDIMMYRKILGKHGFINLSSPQISFLTLTAKNLKDSIKEVKINWSNLKIYKFDTSKEFFNFLHNGYVYLGDEEDA